MPGFASFSAPTRGDDSPATCPRVKIGIGLLSFTLERGIVIRLERNGPNGDVTRRAPTLDRRFPYATLPILPR